jgi:hypothetical protein
MLLWLGGPSNYLMSKYPLSRGNAKFDSRGDPRTVWHHPQGMSSFGGQFQFRISVPHQNPQSHDIQTRQILEDRSGSLCNLEPGTDFAA